MAKMREAVSLLIDALRDFITGVGKRDKNKAAIAAGLAALDAPPRNCDVGTPEERMCRYHRLCREINERYERLGEIPPAFAFPTEFEWEDSLYEEEETNEQK